MFFLVEPKSGEMVGHPAQPQHGGETTVLPPGAAQLFSAKPGLPDSVLGKLVGVQQSCRTTSGAQHTVCLKMTDDLDLTDAVVNLLSFC